ncbi:ATP-binding protein [Ventrimonas sp. CLA-AP-H27]|uniref:ATP-binding protein n=1 Tax=Ventrimonas faecis TaxID=3133170 RepID=A0ABV1HRB1_9FIRM
MEYKEFKISRRVIQHLGKDLITASDVALTELLKNSIDAKSAEIRIHVADNMNEIKKNCGEFLVNYNPQIEDSIPKEIWEFPVCVIEDKGKGMNTQELDKGFLTIGTDLKKDESGMMFGEKGIGRLAAQHLGNYLLIETASSEEPFASTTFIDWNGKLLMENEDDEALLPYRKIEKTFPNYTRLWIFNVNLYDFLETPDQLELNIDTFGTVLVNAQLKSAINFLMSPFEETSKKISFFYNGKEADIDFPKELLDLSESVHSFKLDWSGSELKLDYSMEITPWYIERIHKVAVKDEAFKKLKKEHQFYLGLLKENSKRINNVLIRKEKGSGIKQLLIRYFDNVYKNSIAERNTREEYVSHLADSVIEQLKLILPIKGKVYSFKQGRKIGKDIIIESVNEERKRVGKSEFTLGIMSNFLKLNNGVKLYRGNYRIGFLGNQENDWLKLQQYRTKGQQYYRFDLANIIGYVSVHDDDQEYIQEISSRLDIKENKVSNSFKNLTDIVFNSLFYELNRSATNILRVILEEQGLLFINTEKNIKKQNQELIKSLKKGVVAEKKIKRAIDIMKETSDDEDSKRFSKKEVEELRSIIKDIFDHLVEEKKNQKQAVQLLEEADEQLKAVEVDAYNNFKLMANGLITETITHELDSVCRTSNMDNMQPHFDNLKKELMDSQKVFVINHDVQPIKKSYYAIADKMEEVADLYNFVEKTFIKRGSYDEFENQNIKQLIDDIHKNIDEIDREEIEIICTTDDLIWFVPKGVLVHVFYNLISNSLYWIDRRRKYSISDGYYHYEGKDCIVIESNDPNEILVYDTGTGVIRAMEDILFQPLESGKENHTGRGMGLYIVQQLLRSFSADIELTDDRNEYGNRYKFRITLNTQEN